MNLVSKSKQSLGEVPSAAELYGSASYATLPKPNAKQWALIATRRQQRFTDIGFGGHVRGSKTFGAFIDLLVAGLKDYPGDTFLILRQDHGALQLWFYDAFLEIIPHVLVARSRRTSPMEIELINGTKYIFTHAKNYMKFMGGSLRGIYVDEAHEVAPSIFSMLYTRFTTLAGEDQYCYMVQMVNPCPGHFYDHFYVHRDNIVLPNGVRYRESDGGVIFIPSAMEDNEALGSPERIAQMKALAKAKMPEADYLRFYEGSWESFVGRAFPHFNILYHVKRIAVSSDKTLRNHEDNDIFLDASKMKFMAGFDYGWTNPSCFMLWCYEEADGPMYAVDGFYEPGLDVKVLYSRMKQIFDKYQVDDSQRIVLYDPSMHNAQGLANGLSPIEPMLRMSTHGMTRDPEILLIPAFNRGGIELLNEQFSENNIFFDESLPWAASEHSGAVMEAPSVMTQAKRDSPDRLRRKDDHSIDVTRYVALARVQGKVGATRPKVKEELDMNTAAPYVTHALKQFHGSGKTDDFYGVQTTYDADAHYG